MLVPYVNNSLRRGRSGKDTITVRPNGVIGLGKLLIDIHKLRERTDALLFYDAEDDLIAIKFLDGPQHGSVPIRQQKTAWVISHNGFAKRYDLEPGDYRLVDTSNNLFVFARNENKYTDDEFRRMVVEIPSDIQDVDLCEALGLVGGRACV